jgi:hypothetical protein
MHPLLIYGNNEQYYMPRFEEIFASIGAVNPATLQGKRSAAQTAVAFRACRRELLLMFEQLSALARELNQRTQPVAVCRGHADQA